MRELLFFIASLAGAALLTALAVVVPPQSPFWRDVLYGSIVVLVVCGAVLLIDLLRKSRLWTKRRTRSRVEERAPMWQAIRHVALVINDSAENESYLSARAAIRQAALDGHIHIYGNQSERPMGEGGNYSTVSTLIPQGYWETAELSPLSTSDEFSERFDCHTFPHKMSRGKFGASIKLYAKCTVIWREVLKQWR